jgi:lysophospholipase L1-like esterase
VRSRRFLLSLAVAAALTVGSASAQTFRVVGFGDSITEAIPFDLSAASCQSGNPDSCGYTARLEKSNYYNCAAAGCDFANRGKSGELTPQGLTRIDGVLRERDWDLLVLMHGTNDLSRGVSAQTVQFNLERMASKAKARGIDTAHASNIWFHPSFTDSRTASKNSAAENLRNLLRSQTGANRRCFVDVRSKLCPAGAAQAACFDRHYWKPPAGVTDFVGHPNSSGYEVMAREFYRVLGSRGEPGAAEIVNPSGDACGAGTLVEWRKETRANTSCGNWFRVQISGPGGSPLDKWFAEGDVCRGSECSVTSPRRLSKGNYSVRIQTRNTAGYGPWTADEDFSVVSFTAAGTPRALGPSGQVFSTSGLDSAFRWKPANDADAYRLVVTSVGEGTVIDESLEASDVCTGGECSFSPRNNLGTGRYNWQVSADSVCGGGTSAPILVEVFDGPPASAPQALSPSQRSFVDTPTFRWEAVNGASEYELEIGTGAGRTVAAEDVCVGEICRLTSAALAVGNYDWRVRARNPLGDSPWSALIPFEVADCDCFRRPAAGGSSILMAVPENWNGDLVLWTHASNSFGVRELPDFGPLAQRQFDEGYALATTSYSVTGWPLFKSQRDLEALFRAFSARHGRPSRVFLAGESTGALVALKALESAKIGNAVGALATCGPMAGSTNWEAALDLRLAYDAICSEVAGAEIPGGPRGLPKSHTLEPIDIRAAVAFCTGVEQPKEQRSTEQKQRLAQLLAVTGLPEGGLQDAMQLATFGLADLIFDSKKLKGRLPVGNEGVLYASPDLNASIQRVTAEGGARSKLDRFSELTGDFGDAKVLSMHTSKDPVFFVENQRELAGIASEANLQTAIAREPTASHCGFSEPELVAAWRGLTGWIDGGPRPKAKNLLKRCRQARAQTGGSCRFARKTKISPLDTRVMPRP